MQKSQTDRILQVLLLVALCGFFYSIRDVFEEKIVQAGDSAPSFSVTTLDGRTVSKDDFGGKLLVLNFWATWCPPCIEEFPSLNTLAAQLKQQGVVVLGLSIDKNEAAYKAFVQKNQPEFLVSRDPDANIPTAYGTFKWPETYVIDRSGKVVQKYIGPRDWNDPAIVSSIKALL
jgi:cytochrome c biogenesis protein CcmG/thiol:disulfide interchange protein DsbE